MKIRKIHIIGGPGSGKTYLAWVLAGELKTNAYNLDDIYWDNSAPKYGVRSDEKARTRDLKKILANKSWVVEGVYYEWCMDSFRKADIIVVLRPDVLLRAWRIITRYISRKSGFMPAPKMETLRGLFKLLKWNNDFDSVNLTAAMEIFRKNKFRTVILTNNREIKQFLTGLNKD
jgi:adenylate kinase family enzyme